ncbi:MAG: DNA polymerase III subunit epsilon [Gammaproteobacteria bacterium]|nr:DNA polymerase III subunit epsilon [Gammaproteobacteria bacterium]
MTRQIVLDTETTGLKPEEGHRIIEIGAIEIIDRCLTKNDRHLYINPERNIDEDAFKIHGISTQFLADKPPFAEIAKDFFDYINGAELIIHNAAFDLNFLNHEYRWLNQHYPKIQEICSITDTLAIARKRHVGQKNSLDALCKRYHVNNKHRQLHGARLDALLLAEVFLQMTGGQKSLFDNIPLTPLRTQTNNKNTSTADQQTRAANLPIIHADDAELLAHQKYLQAIQKKNKLPLALGLINWKLLTQC